ncbi:SMP-30/gluconolactonase/LRE family protein [Profundibacter sp.]|uniref:SMP-30/gluconolactonase/LRE family protein n=1 Tax=Profundibacter sp. TaxID=3101071 RepID=UPI003D11080E
MIYDETPCELGEGPLWHPLRGELFWFDILAKRLHTKGRAWQFDRFVSAAGWVDRENLLIADDRSLFLFNLETGERREVCALESDNPATRSNDGRADPWGGFWIGTMGLDAQAGAGAIYRWFRGELRRLIPGVTIPNAICFAPDRRCVYYTDTANAVIWRQPLDAHDGWPKGAAEKFLDLAREGLNPDGAVCDAEGGLWNAQWGASRIARYTPDGRLERTVAMPTENVTCPAFGGPGMKTLFTTSATIGLEHADPDAGKTFATVTEIEGVPENRVIL